MSDNENGIEVFGNAIIEETGVVRGNAKVHGYAVITGSIGTGEEF